MQKTSIYYDIFILFFRVCGPYHNLLYWTLKIHYLYTVNLVESSQSSESSKRKSHSCIMFNVLPATDPTKISQ